MATRHLRSMAATALVLATVPLLCSCSGLPLAFGSTAGGAYAAIDGFRGDDVLSPPSLVPDDATDIRYTTDLADDATILTYRSATHFSPGTCDLMSPTAASSTASTGAALDDSWWPETIPSALFACDSEWTAFVDGDTVYAFTLGSAEPDAAPST